MTDPAMRSTPAESAQDVRRRAAAWLQRRQFWDWSEADQAEFDRWLAESASHRVAYMRVKAVWGRTDRLTALRGASAASVAETRAGWPFLARIAAVIGVVSVLGLLTARYLQVSEQTTWSTPVGGHKILTLADGSQIELNTDTVLRIAADQRAAWLDRGEAYFQIKHDSTHPFAVTAAGKRVVDIGTKFLMRYGTGNLEVALVEGKAKIEPEKSQPDAQLAALLTPGDVATATARSLSVAKRSARSLENELGWRRNLLIFDNATLADVATELNRYNHEQLVITDQNVARLKIVASIPTNGIQAFKRVAKDFLGLHVEDRGEKIVISR